MLVTFLVFASITLVLLVVLLWFLWPRSRVTTSVPGISPSNTALGNIPDIREAGGTARFLKNLHRDHGLIASFWISDFLVVSLGSRSLFKLVGAGSNERPYQSLVPLTSDQDVLENVTKADVLLNKLLSTFSPFSIRAPSNLESSVTNLVDELLVALEELGEEDQIPIQDYMLSLAVKIVSETSPSVARKGLNPAKLRSLYARISVELDLFLDFGAQEFDVEQKSSLSKKIVEFNQEVEGADGRSTVFSQISVISTLATWALYHLAKRPRLQEEIQEDVELQELFLTEVIRVSAFIPIQSKVSSQTVTLLGHSVEEGTLVINSVSSHLWDEKTFPNPAEIDLTRNNCSDVWSFLPPEAVSSYSFQVVLLIVRRFLPTFLLSPACSDMAVDGKFRLMMKPDCDIWLKVKKK